MKDLKVRWLSLKTERAKFSHEQVALMLNAHQPERRSLLSFPLIFINKATYSKSNKLA